MMKTETKEDKTKVSILVENTSSNKITDPIRTCSDHDQPVGEPHIHREQQQQKQPALLPVHKQTSSHVHEHSKHQVREQQAHPVHKYLVNNVHTQPSDPRPPPTDDNQNARLPCRPLQVNKLGGRSAVRLPRPQGGLLKDRVELVVYPQKSPQKRHRSKSPASCRKSPALRPIPGSTHRGAPCYDPNGVTPMQQRHPSPSASPSLPSCHTAPSLEKLGSQTDVEMVEDRPSAPTHPPLRDSTSMMGISSNLSPIQSFFSFLSGSSPPDLRSSTVDPPMTPMSPTSKKKVMFDLRRNQANKFSDYVKSLQRPPTPPPFCPKKSPSQSILKPQPSPMEWVDPAPRRERAKSPRARRKSSGRTKRSVNLAAYRSRSRSLITPTARM